MQDPEEEFADKPHLEACRFEMKISKDLFWIVMQGAASDSDEFEHTVVRIEGSRRRHEIEAVFPELHGGEELFAIFVMQRTQHDLVARGDGPEREKDQCCERFLRFGKVVCTRLRRRGFWADLSDPATGYPIIGDRGGQTHNDLDLVESLLRYPGTQVGACCVVTHPKFGTSVYPATLFCCAPRSIVDSAVSQALLADQSWGEPFEPEERTSTTGIFILPPRTCPEWNKLDLIRQQYFENLRLGPHLSIVDPFVLRGQLDRAVLMLQKQFRPMQFRLRFRRFAALEHPRSVTVYAFPEDDPPGSLQSLGLELARIFPMCTRLMNYEGRQEALLVPHMSIAKVQTMAEAHSLIRTLDQEMLSLEFDVEHVQVCERATELGSGEPFQLYASVSISENSKLAPFFGYGSIEYQRDGETCVLVSDLDASDQQGDLDTLVASAGTEGCIRRIVLQNPRQRNRCQGLVEFSLYNQALAFINHIRNVSHRHCGLAREYLYP